MTRICWPFCWAHVTSSDLGRLVLNKPETNPNCLVSPDIPPFPHLCRFEKITKHHRMLQVEGVLKEQSVEILLRCWAILGPSVEMLSGIFWLQFRLVAPNQSQCPSLDTWTRPPMCPSNKSSCPCIGPLTGVAWHQNPIKLTVQANIIRLVVVRSLGPGKCPRGLISRWFKHV